MSISDEYSIDTVGMESIKYNLKKLIKKCSWQRAYNHVEAKETRPFT